MWFHSRLETAASHELGEYYILAAHRNLAKVTKHIILFFPPPNLHLKKCLAHETIVIEGLHNACHYSTISLVT